MSRVVILVRHGSTGGDNGRRYLGHADLPLGSAGEEQSRALHGWLQAWTIDAVYCSDLSRCRRTAEIATAGRDLPLHARSDLREGRMGRWEGCLKSEVVRDFPAECAARQRDMLSHRPPGGESFADCAGRVLPAFQEILDEGAGTLLLVGHGSTNRLLLCHVLGMPFGNMFRLGQDHGCVNVLRRDEGGWRVTLLNGRP